jgi:hypothetical protein
MPINIAEPAHQLYGIIPQAYAQRLATPTGDPTADAINALNLGSQARRSNMGGYEMLVARAQDAALQAHDLEQQTARGTAYMNQLPNLIDRGAGGAVSAANTGYLVDPRAIRGADVAQRKSIDAATFKTAGEGAEKLAGAGVPLPTEYLSGLITPAEMNKPTPVSQTTTPMTPGQVDSRMSAEADKTQAGAAVTRAANGEGRPDSNNKTVTHYILDKSGNRIPISVEVTDKGGSGDGSGATVDTKIDNRRTIIAPKGHPKEGKVIPNPNFGKPRQ